MFLFFFFKQKTAYEMRISDWSSDVCSSDLLRVVLHGEHGPALDRDALVGAVEEGDVALDHTLGQRRGIDHEAVVLAGDLDLAGGEVLHRVVGATRSEERRGGKEWVSRGRTRWSPAH